MGRLFEDGDFDSLFDLDKAINEAVERHVDAFESMSIGELFEQEDAPVKNQPRKRGRPKGVCESLPRRKISKIKEIMERLVSAISHLNILDEVIRKQGSQYVLYSKDKKKKLGTFKSMKAAKKREQQINYFKNKK